MKKIRVKAGVCVPVNIEFDMYIPDDTDLNDVYGDLRDEIMDYGGDFEIDASQIKYEVVSNWGDMEDIEIEEN